MAHTTENLVLLENLIAKATGLEPSVARFQTLRDHAARQLRSHPHHRTNQFEIRDKYDGLIEKFAVLGREDLADALHARWTELPDLSSKWQPEVLSLLLHLSDRPLEKTDVDAAVVSNAGLDTRPALLTWADILADDPLPDSELWRDVDHGYHSSGDDASLDGDASSISTAFTRTTSPSTDLDQLAQACLVVPSKESLASIQAKYRSLSMIERPIRMSEMWMIRETLFMLHGLPSSLFEKDSNTGVITATGRYVGNTSSLAATQSILRELANVGTSVSFLRHWTHEQFPRRAAYINTLKAGTGQHLRSLDTQLSELEARYLSLHSDTIASLIEVHHEAIALARSTSLLSSVIQTGSREQGDNQYSYLDALYTAACDAQMGGDNDGLAALTNVLCDATRTYLRPIMTWISEGSIDDPDKMLPLVECSGDRWQPGNMWEKRFMPRDSRSGSFNCPEFMQQFVPRLCTLGKTQAFIRELDRGRPVLLDGGFSVGQLPPFAAMRNQLRNNVLSPFSELFGEALHECLFGKAMDATISLKSVLVNRYGLLDFIDAIGYVFHARDGSNFQSFADSLFERIRGHPYRWRDKFILAVLAQESLSIPSRRIPSSAISIHVDPATEAISSSIRALQSVTLRLAIPWPIQNLTNESSPSVDSRAFSLLLQVYFAQKLLRDQYFDVRESKDGGLTLTARKLLIIRQKFIWFADTFHSHITNVTSTLLNQLRIDLAAAADMDAMVSLFTQYRKRMQTGLLLAPNLRTLQDTITKMLELCQEFDGIWQGQVGRQQANVNGEASAPLSAEFDKHLLFLSAGLRGVSRAGSGVFLETLAERLDWNGKQS